MMLLFGKQLGKQQKMKVGDLQVCVCLCVLTETPHPVCDYTHVTQAGTGVFGYINT